MRDVLKRKEIENRNADYEMEKWSDRMVLVQSKEFDVVLWSHYPGLSGVMRVPNMEGGQRRPRWRGVDASGIDTVPRDSECGRKDSLRECLLSRWCPGLLYWLEYTCSPRGVDVTLQPSSIGYCRGLKCLFLWESVWFEYSLHSIDIRICV